MPSLPTRTHTAEADREALEEHPLSVAPLSSDASPERRSVIRGSVPALDWRQALGAALAVIGMIAIIIAWFGVSGTLDPGEQMPYISSGGFGGAALIAIGVTLYMANEHARDRDALRQVLDELDELRTQIEVLSEAAGRPKANGRGR